MFAAVQPICLPDPTEDYENNTALVTGWGNINVTGPQSDVLQEVNVSTITHQDCADKHGRRKITPAMICAGAPGRDACQGDSGGPLAVLGPDGRYSQIGNQEMFYTQYNDKVVESIVLMSLNVLLYITA